MSETKGKESYWSRLAASASPYVAGEQLQDRSYIKLNTNENPYGPGKKVADRLRQMDSSKLTLYPDPAALTLRQAIATEVDLDYRNIFVGNGSDEVLDFAFRAFFDDVHVCPLPILVPELSYSFYPVYAAGHQMQLEQVAVGDDFRIDIATLIRDDAQGVVLTNPNAPTGLALALHEIEALLSELEKRGQFAVIDEAYVDFGGESAVPLLKRYANLLVIQTFSKSRGMAGVRLGFAIGRKENILALETIRDMVNSYNVDTIAQELGIASLADADHFKASMQRIKRTRERFSRRAREEGILVLPSVCNFVLLGIKGIGGDELYDRLKTRGVLVRFLSHPRLVNLVRVTIGSEQEMDMVMDHLLSIKREMEH